MDIGKSFTYVFEDKNWIMKVLIGGIVLLIPIVDFAVYGYMLTTLKNVADGQPNPLPEWSDFGAHFMKGLYAFIGVLIYFLPAILIYCCVFALSFGMTAATSSGNGSNAGSSLGGILGIITLCLNCILAIYALVAGLTLYAPLTRFAMSANQLSLFWDFRGNFAFIQKNLTNYIIALLIAWVASFIAGFGIILCIVGVLFTTFWATLVAANVFGQLWKNQSAPPAMA